MKRKWFAYFLILILAAWIFVMYQNFYSLLLFGMLFMLPWLSFLFFIVTAGKVRVSALLPDGRSVYVGEQIPVMLNISYKGRIPIVFAKVDCTYRHSLDEKEEKEKLPVTAVGGHTVKMCYFLDARHVGRVLLDVKKMSCFDYLGLFCKSIAIDQHMEVDILPRPVAVTFDDRFRYELLANMDRDETEDRPGNNRTAVYDARAYQPGDNIRDIHWKLSARMEDYYIKEYAASKKGKVLFFLNPHLYVKNEKSWKSLDQFFSVLFSMYQAFCTLGLECEVMWQDGEVLRKRDGLKNGTQMLQAVYQASVIKKVSSDKYEEASLPYALQTDYLCRFYLSNAKKMPQKQTGWIIMDINKQGQEILLSDIEIGAL